MKRFVGSASSDMCPVTAIQQDKNKQRHEVIDGMAESTAVGATGNAPGGNKEPVVGSNGGESRLRASRGSTK